MQIDVNKNIIFFIDVYNLCSSFIYVYTLSVFLGLKLNKVLVLYFDGFQLYSF